MMRAALGEVGNSRAAEPEFGKAGYPLNICLV